MLRRSALVAAAFALAASLSTAPAKADFRFPWYPLVDNPLTGTLESMPACASEDVAAKLVTRFNETDAKFWGGHIQMTGVTGLFERGALERGDNKMARRWCQGTALFADGQRRKVVMELLPNVEHLGLAYALSYCVEGLDREWAYKPNCRVLNPKPF